ncbi:MAG: hypothetical protein GC151_11520 [Betaproteobacteria bacterium]|nr:hypothetical protein [Betaproteobacteria bacterium]
MSGRYGRIARTVSPLLALVVAACGNLDVKPQDPSAITRGLRSADDDGGDWVDQTDAPIPEIRHVTFPETSTPKDWYRFKVKNFSNNETALDTASVSVGGDGITRYSLLIRTDTGVDNVSYEGIRCSTREWTMYGTGRPDGSWARVPRPVWRHIDQTGLNAVRFTLYEDYACGQGGTTPANGAAVIAKIKESNDGFVTRRSP